LVVSKKRKKRERYVIGNFRRRDIGEPAYVEVLE